MAGFNRVILMGNLTRDPELRYLPNSTAVCEFGLATNRRFRDKDGNQRDDVCFVEVAAFGRQGETINQYMTKGRPILIEGRLRFESWNAQDGSKRSKLSVIVENFTFVGSREGGQGGGAPAGEGYEGGARPQTAAAPRAAGRPAGQPAAVENDAPPPSNYDDIPF